MTGNKQKLHYRSAHSHEFYVRSHALLRPLCFVLGGLSLLLGLALAGLLWFWQPVDRFFPVGPDGEVIPVQPLTTLNKSDAQLRAWANLAIMDCYTMGPHDYNQALERCRDHFSDAGFAGFRRELADPANRFAERIIDDRQLMSVVPRGTPVILEKITDQGSLSAQGSQPAQGIPASWLVRAPVLVTFEKGDKTRSFKQAIELRIKRLAPSERQSGLGITEWRARNDP